MTALAALGTNIFHVPALDEDTPNFQTVNADSNFTWLQQGRLSRDPAMQFTGPGEDSVLIEGVLYPNHFGGLQTLENLRLAGRAGQTLTLIRFYPLLDPDGMRGVICGRFAIRRLRRAHNKIGLNGVAHQLTFIIELVRYGEDGPNTLQFLDDGAGVNT